ncbi:hypothetical protein FOMPIDRAFT_113570 [Fomitopsis schrenkii]|uniref:Uncharacterized protein n=1 Tax=Fomitopsis schrenkii TaxID=2126942 RepID=S8DIB2_FOMSC|nr:hypothetical protein FOMPIDRAFT_113570 [Fomitopsis schrenkii]
MPSSSHDNPAASIVTISSSTAEEVIALQSAEIARLRAEVAGLKAALAEKEVNDAMPPETAIAGLPYVEMAGMCQQYMGNRSPLSSNQAAIEKSKDECMSEREHAGMKVRLDTAEADLRRFREALNEQHREKDAPVQAPETRGATDSSSADEAVLVDVVIIGEEECISDSDTSSEDMVHIPSPGSSSAASIKIEQQLLEASSRGSSTSGAANAVACTPAGLGDTNRTAGTNETALPVDRIDVGNIEDIFRPLPITASSLVGHVLSRLKKSWVRAHGIVQQDHRLSGILVTDSNVLCWEDYPFRLAWFVESATALRLASTTKPRTANDKCLPFRGPEALIAAFHGALYHFGTYSIRGEPEPLTQADFMRLPWETKKQISRQFVRFNPWWKPEYNAIIAEFERGTLTASKSPLACSRAGHRKSYCVSFSRVEYRGLAT